MAFFFTSEKSQDDLMLSWLTTFCDYYPFHSRTFHNFSSDKDIFDGKDILIKGKKNRNRAIHGDIVVVQLLPASEWCSRTRSLQRQDSSEFISPSDVIETRQI